MKVKFNYLQKTRVPHIMELKAFLVNVIELEEKEVELINYIFCSDSYLVNINKQFLGHDYLTDIITFDLSEDNWIKAEIYISTDRVQENALAYSSSFTRELYRVMLHGVLHLVGYKDKTKSEIRRMRQKEEHYLLLFEKNLNVSL